MFKKILEVSPATWGTLAALVLIGTGFAVLSKTKTKTWSPKTLAVGSLCVAVSFLLSCIRLFHMPQGGSVTPASMLPLLAYAYYFGVAPGLLVGVAAGLLQLLQDFWVLNFTQLLLDYPLAFGALALAGLARGIGGRWGLYIGIAAGCLGRMACSFLSGAVFFGSYAPEGMNPWWYSFGYNGTVMLAEAVICLAIVAIPAIRGALERMPERALSHT